jgi:hypothetical protein
MAQAQQGQERRPSIAEQVLQQAEQQDQGIDQLPSNLPVAQDEEMGMAGGGIVAFAEAGQVVDPDSSYGDIDPLAQFSGLTQADVDRYNRRRLEIQREEQRKADIKKREFLMQNAPGSVASFDFGAGEFEALNNPPAPQGAQVDPRLDNQMLQDSYNQPASPRGAQPGIDKLPSGARPSPSMAQPSMGAPAPQMASAQAQPESAMDRYARMLEAQGDDSAKARKEAKAMAIIQAGLGMMGGTSPNAFANISQGAMPAIQSYQQALQGLRKDDRDRVTKLMEMGLGKEKLVMELKKLGIEDKKADAMVNYYNARAAGGGGGGDDIRRANAIRGLDAQLSTNLNRVDTAIKNLVSSSGMAATYASMPDDKIPKSLKGSVDAYRKKLSELEGQKSKWTNLHAARVRSLGGETLGDIDSGTGAGTLPPGLPPGSVPIGKSGGKTVYRTPDGRQLVEE